MMSEYVMAQVGLEDSAGDSRIIKYKPKKYLTIEQMNRNLSNVVRELKGEVEKLNEKAKRDNYQILILKQQIKTRSKKIAELTEELDSANHENIQISQQMQIQEQSSQILIDTKVEELSAKDSEIVDLRDENLVLKQEIALLREKLMIVRQEQNQTRKTEKLTKAASKTLPTVLFKDMDEKMEKSFSWTITNVHDKREAGKPLKSDYFYVRLNPYKFQLILVSYGTTLNVRLLVHASLSDPKLKWPLHCEVMIKIINSSFPLECSKLKENRLFNRPEPNSFQTSHPFVFSFQELFESHLLARDNFTIECYLTIK